jgi:hypothetical protein
MKIALCFFGITRSLKFTIYSIRENILDIFKLNNIKYDIFMHTYHLTTYKNIRTNECVTNIDNEEYKLLNPTFIEIDDQDEIKKKINMNLYRTHRDPWNTKYNSVDNFILAQYSKSRIVSMIEKQNTNYDYILFIRPDCIYLTKFSMNYFSYINNNTICIPRFHSYGPYNFNDRFAITNMKTYKLYGDIFKHLLNMSKKQPLHSETIIGKIMFLFRIKIVRIPFLFLRVRVNGDIGDKFKIVNL